ncbi:MAG: hypothetical protein HDR26_05385, partial [Lachnospiraceae bacterium]|nr:hypothetical protein [Lachnospiraceae bacterium]
MTEKELTELLIKSSESNRGKYAPWWETDPDDRMYRYERFSEEEIHDVTECAAGCTAETLSAPVGSLGLSLFHLLVWSGFYDAAADALQRGVDASLAADGKEGAQDTAGVTPLMAAAFRGNLQMVRLLLENGAKADVCDAKGRNAYHFLAGCRIGGMANAYEIIKKGMDQREPIARLLSGDINARDDQGRTPLEVLLYGSNTNFSWALSEVYIEKGADVHGKDEEGNSLLITAIRNNHITAALKLMKDKELINLPGGDKKTPLHLALDRYRLELCMALLEHHADKNIQDAEGRTPRDIALERNDADYKQLFTTGRLKLSTLSRYTSNAFAGFSPEEKDQISMALYLARRLIREVDTDDDEEMGMILSILYSALMHDQKCQVLDMLQEAGIDFLTPIHSGGSVECIRDHCLGGNYGVKVIRRFLEMGLDMDEAVIKGRTPANIVASQQERMMMSGQKDDYFEAAAQLFSCESMQQLDDRGTSALHEAVRNNHVDMLRVMLEKGVDVNLTQDAPADAGNTPLHIAGIYGKADVAKLLMENGADDTLQNVAGETPAHLAVMKKKFGGDLSARERAGVLEALEHVDQERNDGKTPLMLLQYLDINTIMEIMPVLLEKGADAGHADAAGNTALHVITQQHSYKGIVKELFRAGADVNAVNAQGVTPLHLALQYGDQESAIFMIKKGADYNCADNRGITPVQIAAEKGY